MSYSNAYLFNSLSSLSLVTGMGLYIFRTLLFLWMLDFIFWFHISNMSQIFILAYTAIDSKMVLAHANLIIFG